MNWLKHLLGIPTPDPRRPSPPTTRNAPAPAPWVPPASPRLPPPASAAPAAPEAIPDFPFPLVTVAGTDAVAAWRRYHVEWRQEGCSAVVLGGLEDLKIRTELLASDQSSVPETLASAATKTAAEFFAARTAEYAEYDTDLEVGEWPKQHVPPSPLTAHTDIGTGNPKPIVYLAKVPTPRPWEVPAYLKAGGWNDCPFPESQIVVLKYWHEKYGAEVYSLTGDVLECLVSRPPSTKPGALTLAREQFLFCSDIVHQGTESIEVLAATLLNSDVWFFWWD